ncbi:uncharacterized protein BDR25DRAFT_348243 [Lindgomyces ingoldianus]|uniref:Uncharacterized protein n=1 Tax=Lindgomyces ingoldianus TaxID=673940 RepID=A0ACB6RI05_9PLEO|nr:uncharacterized protein BDR25DRAFT_348243 [Lindgomyces ingoldianus]KAF2477952.1 hypothetical protein BDR25DRAFT_348243 [Lindgomyces ingoldianus]
MLEDPDSMRSIGEIDPGAMLSLGEEEEPRRLLAPAPLPPLPRRKNPVIASEMDRKYFMHLALYSDIVLTDSLRIHQDTSTHDDYTDNILVIALNAFHLTASDTSRCSLRYVKIVTKRNCLSTYYACKIMSLVVRWDDTDKYLHKIFTGEISREEQPTLGYRFAAWRRCLQKRFFGFEETRVWEPDENGAISSHKLRASGTRPEDSNWVSIGNEPSRLTTTYLLTGLGKWSLRTGGLRDHAGGTRPMKAKHERLTIGTSDNTTSQCTVTSGSYSLRTLRQIRKLGGSRGSEEKKTPDIGEQVSDNKKGMVSDLNIEDMVRICEKK